MVTHIGHCYFFTRAAVKGDAAIFKVVDCLRVTLVTKMQTDRQAFMMAEVVAFPPGAMEVDSLLGGIFIFYCIKVLA